MTDQTNPMQVAAQKEMSTRDDIRGLELVRRLAAHRLDVSLVADQLIELMTRRCHLLRILQVHAYRLDHGLPYLQAEVDETTAAMKKVDEKINAEHLVLQAMLLCDYMEA